MRRSMFAALAVLGCVVFAAPGGSAHSEIRTDPESGSTSLVLAPREQSEPQLAAAENPETPGTTSPLPPLGASAVMFLVFGALLALSRRRGL